jgi:hypothetical protein
MLFTHYPQLGARGEKKGGNLDPANYASRPPKPDALPFGPLPDQFSKMTADDWALSDKKMNPSVMAAADTDAHMTRSRPVQFQ